MSNYEKNQNIEETDTAENRLSAKTRACTWLAMSVVVFLFAVITCVLLISKSAGDSTDKNNQQVHVEDIKYIANNTEDPNVTNPSSGEENNAQKLTAPKSIYNSSIFNILVVGYDEKSEQTDTMILVSVDMGRAQPAMLSIPRDTYIAGNYSVPKINRIYAENSSRGIEALKESVENMFGFRLDKYLVFDAKSLGEILELTDGVSFDIPEAPMYHALSSGMQTFRDEEAFELFRYNDEYTDVETEPYRVQRDFLGKIFDAFLADQDKKFENAEAICNAVKTDLEPSELAYLLDLLKNARFAAAFSRALPGGEITVRDEAYYQVEPIEACEILNGHFNPTGSELTQYDAQFRQQQGSSGEGEMPDWGFGGPRPTTNSDLTEADEDVTEETEPTEEDTQESEENETQENPEDNTENETSEPEGSSEEEIPDEPTETDGDE